MGFSGHLVFARSERPLLEAPLFSSTGPELRDDVHGWQPRPGGWQTLQLEQGIWEDDCLFALVEWTGAPACVADASDSSVALVTGLHTNGRRWQAWLNLDNAAALLVEEPEDVDDLSLWMATPEFEKAIGHKRAELDAEVPADAEGAHVGVSSWCPSHGGAAASNRGTAARTGDLRGGAVRRAAGRAGLP
ncbi:hypothetical protein [Streptomyces sp. CB02261]|uniref:hypothetical protein n=1 Tax=Streptomyces sp. CB02261 TaxID=1703940 RepID=UPI000AD5EFA8|nr:hypothetical protein [Streptomyces sp. CB02261]